MLARVVFALTAVLLTRCASAPPKKIPSPKEPAPALLTDDDLFDRSAEGASYENRDIDEAIAEIRRESRKELARAAAAAERRGPAPRLPRVPVKRLTPRWEAPAVDPSEDVETHGEDEELPRAAAPATLPGTVAESSSEALDELFRAEEHLAAGRIDRALLDARRFLDRDPRHAYADRAERLVVRAHLRAEEWSMAIAAANRLAIDFPGTLAAEDAVRFRQEALAALGFSAARR